MHKSEHKNKKQYRRTSNDKLNSYVRSEQEIFYAYIEDFKREI